MNGCRILLIDCRILILRNRRIVIDYSLTVQFREIFEVHEAGDETRRFLQNDISEPINQPNLNNYEAYSDLSIQLIV